MKKLGIGLLPIIGIIFIIGNIAYTDPTYQDTVVRYYSISPTAFMTGSQGQSFTKEHQWLTAAGWTCVPVYLPDSALVIEFKVWVIDGNLTQDMDASLMRCLFDFHLVDTMASVKSSGGAGPQELVDTTIDYNPVDNTAYKYSIEVNFGTSSYHTLCGVRIKYKTTGVIVSIRDSQGSVNLPHTDCMNSYPTPFSKVTTIQYSVQKRGEVAIEIYDEAGRLVRTLVDDIMPQGSYTARWDGRDSEGRNVPAGSYFGVLKTNGSTTTKVVHIK